MGETWVADHRRCSVTKLASVCGTLVGGALAMFRIRGGGNRVYKLVDKIKDITCVATEYSLCKSLFELEKGGRKIWLLRAYVQ